MRRPARAPPLRAGFLGAAAALGLLGATILGGAPAASGATLVIHVETSVGRPLPGAVVTAHPLDGTGRKVAAVHAVMDQVNRAFAPDLLVIPLGSTVEFPNSDSVSHQIYSFSAAKRFQLPLYHGKPYPPVRFDQAGVVTLGCNIHDDMLAYLVVTDAPFFGRTDGTGAWSSDVTRGHYHVTLWHPRLRDNEADLERDLTVGESDRVELTVRLSKALQPAPLTDRPHSWDY